MLGEYLKALRNERDLSQRALARLSGISNAEISRIESGERKRPSEDILRLLAEAFHIEVHEFFEKSGYLSFNSPIYTFDTGDTSSITKYRKECESKFMSIITPKAIDEGFNISLINTSAFCTALLDRDDYNWQIKFIGMHPDSSNFLYSDRILIDIYGSLVMYDELSLSKFTIATNNLDLYKRFINKLPVNLNVFVSIMLVDLENLEIIDEYIFESPHPSCC